MTDPSHPVWRIVEGGLYLGILSYIMHGNASNFDETEIRTIVEFMLAYTGLKTGKTVIESMLKGKR